jgi:aquaporin Z
MSYNSTQKYLAEGFGTLALVLFGCGSAVIANANGIGLDTTGMVGISLAFGLSVVTMAYTIGHISGCHINPAITVAMLVAGKISVKDALGYIIAQVLGGIGGAGILYMLAVGRPGFNINNGLGQNGWGTGYLAGYNVQSAFLAETVFTFLFLLVIFGTTSKKAVSSFAGLAIGLTLTLIHLVSIPITGTSVNPARSIGPALFVGGASINQLWLFIIAPILGGVLAALFWTNVMEETKTVNEVTGLESDY